MPAALTVVLDGSTFSITAAAGQTLLDAAEASGVELPHQCRTGSCGACIAKLLAGAVDMPDRPVLSKRDRAAGYILACQAVPASETLTISYDE